MSKIIYLRPHHLICITFFKGKGYSDEFVKNMSNIVSTLNQDNTQIILTNTTDNICTHCPKNINNLCADEIKSKAYDEKVIEHLGLSDYFKDPQPIPYSILSHLVVKFILSKGLREEICGDCQWSSICK